MNSIVTLDLEHLGQPNVIASYLVPAPEGGFVLLESGPGSTVPVLERKVEAAGFHLEELLAVFVTHVHLDHAGAAGELARRTGALVAVHPAGAPHMADPWRLLASAGRLYGDGTPRSYEGLYLRATRDAAYRFACNAESVARTAATSTSQ